MSQSLTPHGLAHAQQDEEHDNGEEDGQHDEGNYEETSDEEQDADDVEEEDEDIADTVESQNAFWGRKMSQQEVGRAICLTPMQMR